MTFQTYMRSRLKRGKTLYISLNFQLVEILQSEVELISKNQETWEDIETKTRQYSQGKLEVALEVPRGTHYLRVTNLANISQGTWGDYQSPLTYTIETTYELVEEGEEPWFPPDENAEKWGSVARWIMGFFLLTPAAYLVYSHKRNQVLRMKCA